MNLFMEAIAVVFIETCCFFLSLMFLHVCFDHSVTFVSVRRVTVNDARVFFCMVVDVDD